MLVLHTQMYLVICLCTGKFHLTLERLLLAGVKVTAAADDNVPQLWPLGLFDTVGTGLNISDVRLIVDAVDLQQYLALMQTLPRAVAQYHTVRLIGCGAWLARAAAPGAETHAVAQPDKQRSHCM
jgi:hypothetical protein